MGVVQMVQDWSFKKKLKEGWHEAFKMTPVGCAFRISAPPNDPVRSLAAKEFIQEHPSWFSLMDYRDGQFTLMRRPDINASLSEDERVMLEKNGNLIHAEQAGVLDPAYPRVLDDHRGTAEVAPKVDLVIEKE